MKYKHYQKLLAVKECVKGQKKRYKVITINWTFAGQDKKVPTTDYSQVHKNEYAWTLKHLIKFIRETEDVAEDIIEIIPI